MIFNMNAAADANLNFDVVMQAEQPIPSDNLIWVENDTQLVDWAIASENPYIGYKDTDILNDATIEPGVLGSGGAIESQNATYLQQYTVDYFDVEFGKGYEWSYELSISKSQWLGINEYKADGTHIQRITLVNGVTGTSASGIYTPSANTVAKVRLSWRTFGDSACKVSFIVPKKEYTLDTTEIGSLWIKNSGNIDHQFSSIDEKNIMLSPCGAKVYTKDGWIDSNISICRIVDEVEEWEQIHEYKYLFYRGNHYKDITAYWVKNSGTLTFFNDFMGIKGSTGRVVTSKQIDTTGFKTLEFEVRNSSASKVVTVGIGTSQTAFVASAVQQIITDEYVTYNVDVTNNQGWYYIIVYTTDSSRESFIRSVRLIR